MKIVAAAIRIKVQDEFQEMVWNDKKSYPEYLIVTAPPPARHHTLMHPTTTYTGVRTKPEDQGFLTSDGEFVSREEAFMIATIAGQEFIDHPSRINGVLYSEDLW